jgi:hypothetical protein
MNRTERRDLRRLTRSLIAAGLIPPGSVPVALHADGYIEWCLDGCCTPLWEPESQAS